MSEVSQDITPQDAVATAIQAAQDGDYEKANVWNGIANNLLKLSDPRKQREISAVKATISSRASVPPDPRQPSQQMSVIGTPVSNDQVSEGG